VPLLQRFVGLHSIKAQLAAKLNQVAISVPFTIKAMLKDAPVLTVGGMFSIVTLWMAHALTVAERGACWVDGQESGDSEACPFASYANAIWNIIITATTVGYGDMYPLTDAGRTVAILAACVGTLVISTLVTVMDQNSKFQEPEENVLRLIKKDDAAVYGMNLAASRVQLAWITLQIRRGKKNGASPWAKMKVFRAYSKLSFVIQSWRAFSRKMKYHKHYSFLEQHISEQNYIYRIAKETCDELTSRQKQGLDSTAVQTISLNQGGNSSQTVDGGNAIKQQMLRLEERQVAMEKQMVDGFSRLETAIIGRGRVASLHSTDFSGLQDI